METAQSSGDDTHAAVNIGQERVGARTTRRVGSFVSMGCRPGPSIGAQTSTRTKASVRPGHLVHQTGTKTTKERNCDKNRTLKDNEVKAIGTRAVRPFSEDMSLYLLVEEKCASFQVGRSSVVDIYLGGGG